MFHFLATFCVMVGVFVFVGSFVKVIFWMTCAAVESLADSLSSLWQVLTRR